MGAAIISRESSTGVNLLSAFKRGRAHLTINELHPPGLSTVASQCPPMLLQPIVAAGGVQCFPVIPNVRWRFSGDASLISAAPGALSLESAGMAVILGTQANAFDPNYSGPAAGTYFNAARLSAQTALLQNAPISFDPWELDCNDMLQDYPGAQTLLLRAIFAINDTTLGQKQVQGTVNFIVAAAQFTNYHFDRWE